MELNIHYKRQMDRNYMVINGEEGVFQPNYEMRMLAENEIQGFMKLSIRQVDCHLEYCYDISSMQPLSRIYQTRKLGLKEVQTLFFSLKRQMEFMAPYLLEGYHLLLEPDYIYIQPQNFQVYFSYDTEVVMDFQKALRELIQFVLEKLNHDDQEGIVAVYQMYQRSLEESITVEELLKVLFASYEKEKEDNWQKAKEIEVEKGQGNREVENVWNGEIVNSPVSQSVTLWKKEKKKQRFGILVCSIAVLIGALFWIVLKEVWKDSQLFLLCLVGTAIGLFYNIWNLQQMKKEELLDNQMISEKTEEKILIAYENFTGTSEENVTEQENVEEVLDDGDQKKDSKQQKEVLFGNTGPLKNKENHALISDNPGLWTHIQMAQYPYTIGRIPESCHAVLDFQEISRLHAEIQKMEDEIVIMDLNSSNGTYVNGVRLEANTPVSIKTGDKICLAHISYTFY